MKIGEYEQMMAYLTRPGFGSGTIPGGYSKDAYKYIREIETDIAKSFKKYKAGGGTLDFDTYSSEAKQAMFGKDIPAMKAEGGRVNLSDGTKIAEQPGGAKIAEPSKSMQVDTTTSNPIPEYDITDFRNDAELFILAYHNNTLPRADIADKLNAFAQKGVDAGTFSMQDAGVMVRRLIGEVKDRAQKQRLRDVVPEGIGTVERENKAFGTEPNEFNNQPLLSLEESTTGPGGFPLTAGISILPEAYSTVKKATDLIQSVDTTPAKAKKILSDFFKQREPYGGATKVGESTPKDFTPEKNFLSVLKSYMSRFNPTLTGAAKDIGTTRNTLKGIAERINLQEIGKRTSDLGFDPYAQVAKIPEPKDGIQYKEMTTLMKRKPEDFINLKKQKDEFLDPESMGHYLGVKFARDDKGIRTNIGKFQYDQLSTALRNLNVKKNKKGEYSVNDAINKLLEKNKFKPVKGERKSDIGLGRYEVEQKFDPELHRARANVKQRISTRSQGLDVYLARAVDDVGHPFSLAKSEGKYKKLFKDSNMNRLNTLVYQDNLINSHLFKNSGYEKKYEKTFDKLLNVQNKKVTPEIRKKLLEAKKELNDNYNYIQNIIKNPKLLDKYLNRKEMLADKNFLNYLTNQGDRVQKIDINIPKVGEKFKSEDIFVDMSKINPKYIVGYVNNINPNARKFKDLSLSEQELYKNNLLMQNAEIVSEFYKKAKFPKEDIEAVRETVGMEYAKGGRVNLKKGTTKQPIFKKGAAKQLSKLALVNPASILGLNYLFGIDPESSLDRTALAAEAALSKEIVRGSQELVKNLPKEKRRAVQRLLNLGMSPKLAIKAARLANPLGILSLLGEGSYQAYKKIKEDPGGTMMQKIDALKEAKDDYYEKGEMFSVGGRAGFADGPEDPSKRKFMKILGGLSTLPIVGRFFDVAQTVAPIVDKIKTTDLPGKPEWFDALVNKVIREGTDMTKQFATKEREIVHATKISEDEFVRVHQDLETGSVRVDYDSPFNMGEETVSLEFRPGIADETTKGKPRDEFQATEVEPRYVGGPEDTDMEFDGIGGGSSIKMLESDVSNLEKFATGKNPTMKELVDSKKRKDRVKKINEDQLEAAEYISGKYGDGPEPDYDDFID